MGVGRFGAPIFQTKANGQCFWLLEPHAENGNWICSVVEGVWLCLGGVTLAFICCCC